MLSNGDVVVKFIWAIALLSFIFNPSWSFRLQVKFSLDDLQAKNIRADESTLGTLHDRFSCVNQFLITPSHFILRFSFCIPACLGYS